MQSLQNNFWSFLSIILMFKCSTAQTAHILLSPLSLSLISSTGNSLQTHALTAMFPPKWETCDCLNYTTVLLDTWSLKAQISFAALNPPSLQAVSCRVIWHSCSHISTSITENHALLSECHMLFYTVQLYKWAWFSGFVFHIFFTFL